MTYVLLLNPDTVVRPGAIQTLLEFMEEHPQAGIAGSRLEEWFLSHFSKAEVFELEQSTLIV